MKNCSKCKRLKDYKEFYSDKRAIDKLQSQCKRCFIDGGAYSRKRYEETHKEEKRDWAREYNKAYMPKYYALNKELLRQKAREKYHTNIEASRANGRMLAKKHKEKSNLRARLWYLEHKQLMINRAKEWKSKNKEKVQINTRSYASRKKYASGSYSTKDFLKIKNNLQGVCGYCGVNKADTVDHIIPLSRGGSNNIGNIMPACGTCNYSKQCKTIIEWRYKVPVCTRYV